MMKDIIHHARMYDTCQICKPDLATSLGLLQPLLILSRG